MYITLLVIMIILAITTAAAKNIQRKYIIAIDSIYIIFFEIIILATGISWNGLERASLMIIPACVYLETLVVSTLFDNN